MKKIKTSLTTGSTLNWLVARCEGQDGHTSLRHHWKPSTNWSQGGPIGEREEISASPSPKMSVLEDRHLNEKWMATDKTGLITEYGPTELVAKMRCFVASRLGDEVEIPKELS